MGGRNSRGKQGKEEGPVVAQRLPHFANTGAWGGTEEGKEGSCE